MHPCIHHYPSKLKYRHDIQTGHKFLPHIFHSKSHSGCILLLYEERERVVPKVENYVHTAISVVIRSYAKILKAIYHSSPQTAVLMRPKQSILYRTITIHFLIHRLLHVRCDVRKGNVVRTRLSRNYTADSQLEAIMLSIQATTRVFMCRGNWIQVIYRLNLGSAWIVWV